MGNVIASGSAERESVVWIPFRWFIILTGLGVLATGVYGFFFALLQQATPAFDTWSKVVLMIVSGVVATIGMTIVSAARHDHDNPFRSASVLGIGSLLVGGPALLAALSTNMIGIVLSLTCLVYLIYSVHLFFFKDTN